MGRRLVALALLLAGFAALITTTAAVAAAAGPRRPLAHHRRYTVNVATRRNDRAQGDHTTQDGGEAETFSDKVHMTRWDGRKFECHVAAAPPMMPRDDGMARDGALAGAVYSHHPAWSLHTHAVPPAELPALDEVDAAMWSLEGRCFFLRSAHYWSVEFCYGEHVKQVHRNADGSTVELLLGRADTTAVRRVERSNHTLEPFVAVPHVQGAMCNGGTPRRVEVRLRCAAAGLKHRIVALHELSSCVYELDFETPLLCGLHAFSRHDDPALPIACTPAEGEDDTAAPLEEMEERLGAPAGVWSVADTDTLERKTVVRLSDLPLQELLQQHREELPSTESMLHAMRFFLMDSVDTESHAMASGSAMLARGHGPHSICIGSSAQGAHAMVYDVSTLASDGMLRGEYYDAAVGFVGRETATRQASGGPSWVPATIEGNYELVGYAHDSPAEAYRGTLRIRQRDEHGHLFSLAWILHHGKGMPTTFTGIGQLRGDDATHMCVAWSRSGQWFVRNQVWTMGAHEEHGSYTAQAYAAELREDVLVVQPHAESDAAAHPAGSWDVFRHDKTSREKTPLYRVDIRAVAEVHGSSREHNVFAVDVRDGEGAVIHHTTGVYDAQGKGDDMCVVASSTSALLLHLDLKRGLIYGDWFDLATSGHGHESAHRADSGTGVEGMWSVVGKQFAVHGRTLEYTAQLRISRRGRSQTYLLEWILEQGKGGHMVVRGVGVRYGDRMCVSWASDLYSVGVLRLAFAKRKRGQMAVVQGVTETQTATWMDARGTPAVMERLAAGKAAQRVPSEGVWTVERDDAALGTFELKALEMPGTGNEFFRVTYNIGDEPVSGWGILSPDGVLCASKGTFRAPVVMYNVLGGGVMYGTWLQGDTMSHGVEVARGDALEGSVEGEFGIEGSEHGREIYEGMMRVRSSTHAAGRYLIEYHMGPAGGIKDASFTGTGVRNDAYLCAGWGLENWPVEAELFRLEERGGERVAVVLEAELEAPKSYFDDGDEWE